MRTETKRKADILIENRNILKGAFKLRAYAGFY
jgi:hypothetical protein